MSAPPVYIRPPPGVYVRPPAIAYSAPVQPRQQLGEAQWRAEIMRQAREFCGVYPNDPACSRPDGPPASVLIDKSLTFS
jgi:hypothetical protein